MENKQSPSKKNLNSIKEERLLREVNYDFLAGDNSRSLTKPVLLDFEIFQKNRNQKRASQRVTVSIKPRVPVIKTLYIAEKSRFNSRKGSDKSGSRLGIGDHSSFTTRFSDDYSNLNNSTVCSTLQQISNSEKETSSFSSEAVPETSTESKCSHSENSISSNLCNVNNKSAEKCYLYTQPHINMNTAKPDVNSNKKQVGPSKVDKATLFISQDTSSEESSHHSSSSIYELHKRIVNLEKKVLRQEMVFRSLEPNLSLSSSDEECKNCNMKTNSVNARAGCSYIEQYSHVPETSAFQRNAQTAPLSPSKSTTIEKEHNSEQYGRDFTAYDGLTARGRRQSASVPCRRDEIPKMAAERIHKIRHKLNPVRDYRLMDTVHYLAQGEFAPRDDGIKLTPSREAVLSDIIWEDVCRTHWPNARLSRRVAHPERYSTRCELQRLIDSLLRERVAHVERRRRRHYRIVKLNHRHESCRPVGKTGDIIVASHKNKHASNDRDVAGSEHKATNAIMNERRRAEMITSRRSPRSHDHLGFPEINKRFGLRSEECSPGPSNVGVKSAENRKTTCCYHASGGKPERKPRDPPFLKRGIDLTSRSSLSTNKPQKRNPRLVVKKELSRRRYQKEEPNLEHYILLPTLVVRTPSNIKRQKKFSELYHRILNVHLQNQIENHNCSVGSESAERRLTQSLNKKDIGLNINITLSNSEEQILKK